MTDDLHSLAREIEALDEAIADANADKAEVFRRAKKALRDDLPAFRDAMATRRKRDKNPAAYQELKGRAAELLDALDNGVVVEHARAPARTRPRLTPSEAPSGATAASAGSDTVTEPQAASDTPFPSPAGGASPNPADPLPVAAAFPSAAVPAGDPDEHWEKRDSLATFELGHAVAGGKEPAGEVDTAKTQAVIARCAGEPDDPLPELSVPAVLGIDAGKIPDFLRHGSAARAAAIAAGGGE